MSVAERIPFPQNMVAALLGSVSGVKMRYPALLMSAPRLEGLPLVEQLEAQKTLLQEELARIELRLSIARTGFEDSAPCPPLGPTIGKGSATSALCPAFGYLSKSAGCYVDTINDSPRDGSAGPPSSLFDLATRNFRRELSELQRTIENAINPSGEEALSRACTPI